jgi:general secretion pathway protein I
MRLRPETGNWKVGDVVTIPFPGSRFQVPVSNRGFTLIEILVAISVLSICMVVILQLFSGGLKSIRLSDAYTRGIFHAREKIEEILLGTEFAEEVSEGEFDDAYRWRSEIVREEQSEEEAKKLPFDAFHIRVDIFWNEGDKEKSFGVATMKLVEKKKDDRITN